MQQNWLKTIFGPKILSIKTQVRPRMRFSTIFIAFLHFKLAWLLVCFLACRLIILCSIVDYLPYVDYLGEYLWVLSSVKSWRCPFYPSQNKNNIWHVCTSLQVNITLVFQVIVLKIPFPPFQGFLLYNMTIVCSCVCSALFIFVYLSACLFVLSLLGPVSPTSCFLVM